MGMFDSFYLTSSKAAKLICCAVGHPQFNVELQTKDLECSMDNYYIHSDLSVYKYNYRDDDTIEKGKIVVGKDGAKFVKEVKLKPAVLRAGPIEVYTSCKQCDPIVIETENSFMGRLNERYVWCSWNLFFKRNVLERVESVRLQTREQLRAEILKGGCDRVLDDNDRIAQKHLKQLRSGKNDRF